MTKQTKAVVGIVLVEIVLATYFFYIQPLCEPCLPGAACPACISTDQIIIVWLGAGIAVVTVILLITLKFKERRQLPIID